ncbi:MAG: hypothetical protein R3B72_20395 [Polyangiaceae bacterium]
MVDELAKRVWLRERLWLREGLWLRKWAWRRPDRLEVTWRTFALFLTLVGLGWAGMGCKPKSEAQPARFSCSCPVLTDMDDRSSVGVEVCAENQTAAEVAAPGCAQSNAPGTVESCHCAPASEPRVGEAAPCHAGDCTVHEFR